VTTTQGPQRRTTIQGLQCRYPILLHLHYKAPLKNGALHGFGQTRTISSKDITFGPGDGLEPGMRAEIAVAWPFFLDGRIRLQLVLKVSITDSQEGVVRARILAYDFRTCRGAAEHGVEPRSACVYDSPHQISS
jgi:hypothetical protein